MRFRLGAMVVSVLLSVAGCDCGGEDGTGDGGGLDGGPCETDDN
jgi:hypothetical protein